MNYNKIRLVGGPAGGKVMEHPQVGRNEIVVRVPKKMSRKRRYELMSDPQYYPMYYASATGQPGGWKDPRIIDGMVEALYRISIHPHVNSNPITGGDAYSTIAIHNLPCMHPDGSVFYEYVEGTKKELT